VDRTRERSKRKKRLLGKCRATHLLLSGQLIYRENSPAPSIYKHTHTHTHTHTCIIYIINVRRKSFASPCRPCVTHLHHYYSRSVVGTLGDASSSRDDNNVLYTRSHVYILCRCRSSVGTRRLTEIHHRGVGRFFPAFFSTFLFFSLRVGRPVHVL